MKDIFRETVVGQLIYYASGRRLLSYDEDRPGYVPPAPFLPEEKRRETQTSTEGSDADQATLVERGQPPPADSDPYLVDWYGPDDPLNPLSWSNFKKAFVTFGLCILTFGVYTGSSIYSPGEIAFSKEMHIGLVPSTLGLTLCKAADQLCFTSIVPDARIHSRYWLRRGAHVPLPAV
jgi:DHA1 family multidrug resistance protein-like MFS transporter